MNPKYTGKPSLQGGYTPSHVSSMSRQFPAAGCSGRWPGRSLFVVLKRRADSDTPLDSDFLNLFFRENLCAYTLRSVKGGRGKLVAYMKQEQVSFKIHQSVNRMEKNRK